MPNSVFLEDSQSGSIIPLATNTYTLGSASFRWANVYSVLGNFSGQVDVGTLVSGVGGAATPSVTFTGFTGTGLRTRSGILCGSVGGAAEFEWYTSGLEVKAATVFTWSATSDPSAGVDTGIGRNGAGIVEVNNGTLGTLRDFKARAYFVGATAGASFSGAVTNITVVNGIVTAAS